MASSNTNVLKHCVCSTSAWLGESVVPSLTIVLNIFLPFSLVSYHSSFPYLIAPSSRFPLPFPVLSSLTNKHNHWHPILKLCVCVCVFVLVFVLQVSRSRKYLCLEDAVLLYVSTVANAMSAYL